MVVTCKCGNKCVSFPIKKQQPNDMHIQIGYAQSQSRYMGKPLGSQPNSSSGRYKEKKKTWGQPGYREIIPSGRKER